MDNIRIRLAAQSKGLSYEEMQKIPDHELLCIPNFGRKSLKEFRKHYPYPFEPQQKFEVNRQSMINLAIQLEIVASAIRNKFSEPKP